jgi:ABC-type glycerol-3-phosphate transport system substrate-binding protein
MKKSILLFAFALVAMIAITSCSNSAPADATVPAADSTLVDSTSVTADSVLTVVDPTAVK